MDTDGKPLATRIATGVGKILFSLRTKKLPEQMLLRSNQGSARKVLLLKVGAIGDILMTTPLVRKLSKAGYAVDYAVGVFSHPILVGNPHLRELIVFDDNLIYGKQKSIIENLKLIKKIRHNNYDLILVLDKSWMAGIYAWFCSVFKKTLRIGFDRQGEGFANNVSIPYLQNKHDSLSYLDLAIPLEAVYDEKNKENWKMDIFLKPEDRKFAKRFFQQLHLSKQTIGIVVGGGKNPGQSFNLKIWSKERYAELVAQLIKKQDVLLLGGPSDKEDAEFVMQAAQEQTAQTAMKRKTKHKLHKLVSAVGETSIHQSIALMERCKKIVCSDSGPMHMAATVNENIISIFGPTDPNVYAPLHKKSRYIWKEDCACYTIFGTHTTCTPGMIDKTQAEDVLKALR